MRHSSFTFLQSQIHNVECFYNKIEKKNNIKSRLVDEW